MILEVPYVSQWTINSRLSANDCGPACLHDLLLYLANTEVKVDDITRYIGTKDQVRFNTLQSAAEHFGIAMKREKGWNLNALKSTLDERKPVIVCVEYGKMPTRLKQDQASKSGHYMVVVGYQDGELIYHDSNYKGSRVNDGAFLRISEREFSTAWNTNVGIAFFNSALVPVVGKEDLPVVPDPVPPTPNKPEELSNFFVEILNMNTADAVDAVALGYIFADMALRYMKGGVKFTFHREADGAIFVNARRGNPGALWVTSMATFHAIGGVDGEWTQY